MSERPRFEDKSISRPNPEELGADNPPQQTGPSRVQRLREIGRDVAFSAGELVVDLVVKAGTRRERQFSERDFHRAVVDPRSALFETTQPQVQDRDVAEPSDSV